MYIFVRVESQIKAKSKFHELMNDPHRLIKIAFRFSWHSVGFHMIWLKENIYKQIIFTVDKPVIL